MKINKDLFLEKINIASKFVSGRSSSSSFLQGVLIKKEKENLYFYSTNLNFYYKGLLKTEGKDEFKFIVEPKKIIEFLSFLLPGDIEINTKEKSITISQQKTKGEFPVFSADDFPFLNESGIKKQKINIKKIKEIFPLISFASSSDETRPVLTGINFDVIDETTNIVATDGFRLSLWTIKEKMPFSSIIISSSFFEDVLRFVGSKEEIDFSYNEKEKVITFYLDEGEFSSRLIEGEYPPYERVIPQQKTTEVLIERDDFLRGVKLATVFAKEFSNIVFLNIEKDHVKIAPKTNTNEENFSIQEAEVKGEPIKVAFNSKFLIDFLNKADSSKIKIQLLRPDAPVVFKIEKNPDFLHIIMPIRIQD